MKAFANSNPGLRLGNPGKTHPISQMRNSAGVCYLKAAQPFQGCEHSPREFLNPGFQNPGLTLANAFSVSRPFVTTRAKSGLRVVRVNSFYFLEKIAAVDYVITLNLTGTTGEFFYQLLEDFKLVSRRNFFRLKITPIP